MYIYLLFYLKQYNGILKILLDLKKIMWRAILSVLYQICVYPVLFFFLVWIDVLLGFYLNFWNRHCCRSIKLKFRPFSPFVTTFFGSFWVKNDDHELEKMDEYSTKWRGRKKYNTRSQLIQIIQINIEIRFRVWSVKCNLNWPRKSANP